MKQKSGILVTPSAGYLLPLDVACEIAKLLIDAEPLDTSYDTTCGYAIAEQTRYTAIAVHPLTPPALAEVALSD